MIPAIYGNSIQYSTKETEAGLKIPEIGFTVIERDIKEVLKDTGYSRQDCVIFTKGEFFGWLGGDKQMVEERLKKDGLKIYDPQESP